MSNIYNMKAIFIRHGQTYENTVGISMGQTIDSNLNDVGIKQAINIANVLKNQKIDYLYSSDMKRCLETAQEVIKNHSKLKIIPCPELKERNHGIHGGILRKDREALEKSSGEIFGTQRFPEGESYLDLQKRIYNFYLSLIGKHKNNQILIVSHVGAIAMLILKILNLPITKDNYKKYKLKNGAIAIIENTDKNKHKLIQF